MDLKPNEYRCEACNGVFEKGWSDDQARSELGEAFPGVGTEDCGMVCDDCYRDMKAKGYI